jgi:hypothetical protein
VGSRASLGVKEKKDLALAGNWTPAVLPVAIPTELPRLSYDDFF